MTAGTGITHSEMNASKDEPVHFFQIWIEPNSGGHAPGYQQIEMPEGAGEGGFTPIVTPKGGDGQVSIHQDAIVSVAKPVDGEELDMSVPAGRKGFLQVIKGRIALDGEELRGGDGLEFIGDKTFSLKSLGDAEVLLFNLP